VTTSATPSAIEPETPAAAGPPEAPFRGAFDAPGTTTGWIVKIILLGVADAIALVGLLIAFNEEAWGYFAVLAVTLVALNVVYLPRRFVPMKYLLPGIFFLLCFGVYPVLYTAYISTTNYGTGFVLSKDQAIDQIQRQSITRAEGATAYDVTPMAGEDGAFAGYGLFDPESGEAFLGTTDGLEALEDVETQLLTTTGRTFIVSAGELTGVRPGEVDQLPGYPTDTSSYVIPGETEGSAIGVSGGQAFESASTRVYDADADTITDTETGVVYRVEEGQFISEDGQTLTPGFTASVGLSNYADVLTGDEFRSSFLRVLVWNLAFALLSVVTCFGLGLLLALVFNDERLKGRKIYRSLIIIPYALPAFMTALVWRGLLNTTFGINRWLGTDIGWLESTPLAMFSLILVNMWLGYPYMFLVCTGALQSIPSDLKEASFVDGATGLTTFRKVTFPLLLTAVSPLLVASFAFNFNNFTIVYLLTGGQPRSSGETAGSTDILLTWVYRIALDLDPKRQGIAAALTVLIFLIVAVLAAAGFKATKTFEEVR
jgi:arabinogalactan oligomer/maltooligosaccharide transport system permease protein